MEDVRDIAAVPGGGAAADGLIQIEKIGEGTVVQGGTLRNILDFRSAENIIQPQKVHKVPAGIGFPEEGKEHLRPFVPDEGAHGFLLLRGGHGSAVPGSGGEGEELAEYAAHQQRDAARFLPEPHGTGIARVEPVGVRLAARIFPRLPEGGTQLQVRFGQEPVIHGFQFLHGREAQPGHNRFGQLPAGAFFIGQKAADDAAHVDSLRVQTVRGGGLQQGGYLGAAAGLAEDRNIGRVSAEPFDVVPDPPEGGDNVIRAGIGGVGIFLPEIGQIEVAQDIQAVIDGHHHHIPQAGHVRTVIGGLLDGGTGLVAAAVEPHQHRPGAAVQPRGPDVQVQTVFIHGPVPVGHIQFAAGAVVGHQGTDETIAGGILHTLPLFHGFGGVEPPGCGVGNALEDAQAIMLIAFYESLCGFHQGRGAVKSESLIHYTLSLLICGCRNHVRQV